MRKGLSGFIRTIPALENMEQSQVNDEIFERKSKLDQMPVAIVPV